MDREELFVAACLAEDLVFGRITDPKERDAARRMIFEAIRELWGIYVERFIRIHNAVDIQYRIFINSKEVKIGGVAKLTSQTHMRRAVIAAGFRPPTQLNNKEDWRRLINYLGAIGEDVTISVKA
jgi:hypothetical protein